MRKLNKLKLKKQTIVNLNDYEMNQVKGGSTWTCVGSTAATVTAVIATYNQGKDESLWHCPPSKEANCMSAVSERWAWYDDIKHCDIDNVDVYGFY